MDLQIHRLLHKITRAMRDFQSFLGKFSKFTPDLGLTTRAHRPRRRNHDLATQTAPRGSVQRMVRPMNPGLSKSESELQVCVGDPCGIRSDTDASQLACNDLSMSLPSVLSLAECPKTGMLDDLARTSPHREEAQALMHLWQSLGCPATGFWQHTRVFVNRVILAYRSNSINWP